MSCRPLFLVPPRPASLPHSSPAANPMRFLLTPAAAAGRGRTPATLPLSPVPRDDGQESLGIVEVPSLVPFLRGEGEGRPLAGRKCGRRHPWVGEEGRGCHAGGCKRGGTPFGNPELKFCWSLPRNRWWFSPLKVVCYPLNLRGEPAGVSDADKWWAGLTKEPPRLRPTCVWGSVRV